MISEWHTEMPIFGRLPLRGTLWPSSLKDRFQTKCVGLPCSAYYTRQSRESLCDRAISNHLDKRHFPAALFKPIRIFSMSKPTKVAKPKISFALWKFRFMKIANRRTNLCNRKLVYMPWWHLNRLELKNLFESLDFELGQFQVRQVRCFA